MSDKQNKDISKQREMLSGRSDLQVVDYCGRKNGVIVLDSIHEELLEKKYNSVDRDITFFIPASGSGSRMFGFLYDFMASGVKSAELEIFINRLTEFPFYDELLNKMPKGDVEEDKRELFRLILEDPQFNYGDMPKGLIPFHKEGDIVYNAFQEHVRQAVHLLGKTASVQFTIQDVFEKEIKSSINKIIGKLGIEPNISFTCQDPQTDAYCFDIHHKLVEVDGIPVRRPAGHGALLKNLNALEEPIVFVKNIDNIQHSAKADPSVMCWQLLTGLLEYFKEELIILANGFSYSELKSFNDKFEFFLEDELDQIRENDIKALLSRPSRVCGMVVNTGEPGGGPFWVKKDRRSSKQIVEKIQIPSDRESMRILEKSTHFNPVFMVLDKDNPLGERCDLMKFSDSEAFIRVKKNHKGGEVIYHEMPGLWNGAMSKWNTLFVELPEEIFSPVKTVLDLLKPAHRS